MGWPKGKPRGPKGPRIDSRPLPGTPGNPGRKAGSKNKITREIKEMVEGALHELGGVKWLTQAARAEPAAFLGLIGKLIPKDIKLTHRFDNLSDAELDRQIRELSGQIGAAEAVGGEATTH